MPDRKEHHLQRFCGLEERTVTMWILSKVSTPDWDKTFLSEQDAIAELKKHICGECMSGKLGYVDSSVLGDVAYEQFEKPDGSLASLLSTPCGLEYDIWCGHE